jgi:hypothetical protein
MDPQVHKEINNPTSGAQKLFKMVEKAHGNVLTFPIKPQYNLSTDNTVNYIFEGKGTSKGQFQLAGASLNKS